jgi:hypothetical protein
MRIHPVAFGALVLVVFFGTIGVAAATDAWTTTGRTAAGGGRVSLDADAAPTEVKGWMAIGDVAEAFAVPLPDVLVAFGLPADTAPSTPLKELESDLFSVAGLRLWLTEHAGGSSDSAP